MITLHFVELGIAYLLAAMIPGPSLALIIKNGILNSRLSSIQACMGTIVGTALQSGFIIIGLIFIDHNSTFFKTIKILCSVYLIYLGFRTLLSNNSSVLRSTNSNNTKIKHWDYFFEGFLVEFLNPLAFTFFISIMTIIISPQEPWYAKVTYWIEIIILCSMWFFTVALVLSSEKITFYTKRFSKLLEILAGVIFILFGSKMFYI
ncbi:unnamed protein product [Ectocarpus sp. 12 AP-2014]